MAYVRLDDSVMDNPKMLALSDRAFRGWVWGLCYAQRHLTDGHLPLAALTLAVKRAAGELQSRGLWEIVDGGFQIHDYLKHQDSKQVVERRKQQARDRMQGRRAGDVRANRERTASEPAQDGVREAPLPSLSLPAGVGVGKEGSGEKTPTARSGRPIFTGTRFAVFEWQLDDCVNTLGGPDAAEAFDLPDFFHRLNHRCERENVVAPKRDGGAWLQAELVKEANRRGIPLRIGSTQPEAGKLTTRMASMVRNAQ